jgi:predicted  nucleic acid-binding Zn-ribbon protein
MKDPQLEALAAEIKTLKARIAALEKLLERILRQKPVSEKQLERALRTHGAGGTDLGH